MYYLAFKHSIFMNLRKLYIIICLYLFLLNIYNFIYTLFSLNYFFYKLERTK